jgi:hypothetical protein
VFEPCIKQSLPVQNVRNKFSPLHIMQLWTKRSIDLKLKSLPKFLVSQVSPSIIKAFHAPHYITEQRLTILRLTGASCHVPVNGSVQIQTCVSNHVRRSRGCHIRAAVWPETAASLWLCRKVSPKMLRRTTYGDCGLYHNYSLFQSSSTEKIWSHKFLYLWRTGIITRQ